MTNTAPIVIDSSLADRAHNPLLVALQLNHHAPRLTPAAQLSLRVGGPAPRYPSAIPSRAWRQLCLADHGPHRPTPDLAWIPQVLWPASIPQLPADSPTHAAVAALALGRTGSTRPFGLIALELGLPTSHASNVGAVWRSLHRSGQWETFLTAVDALMTRLQDHPPPVNYRTRRVLGDDTDLLERALTATAQQIGTPLPTADLPGVLARFWELFTGGDITFAPDQLRIPVKRTRHRRHVAQRGLLDRHHLPLYEATLATLKDQSLLTIDGPLTWIPP